MHLRGPGETTNVLSPKRKCRNFDEIFITDYTGSCHFDNFQCSLWWKFRQNNIPVSLLIKKILETYSRNLQLHHSLATLSAWLAFCEGNPLQGTYGSPHKDSALWSFGSFYFVSMNKLLFTQRVYWWYETPWGYYDVSSNISMKVQRPIKSTCIKTSHMRYVCISYTRKKLPIEHSIWSCFCDTKQL